MDEQTLDAKVFANDDYGLLSEPSAYLCVELRHAQQAHWRGGSMIDIGYWAPGGDWESHDVINVWDYEKQTTRYPFTPKGMERAISGCFIWAFTVSRSDTESIEHYFTRSQARAVELLEALAETDHYETERHNLRGDFPRYLMSFTDDAIERGDSVFWIDDRDSLQNVKSADNLAAFID